jgi:hypothetical protein
MVWAGAPAVGWASGETPVTWQASNATTNTDKAIKTRFILSFLEFDT